MHGRIPNIIIHVSEHKYKYTFVSIQLIAPVQSAIIKKKLL